jgi:hypothetical protein
MRELRTQTEAPAESQRRACQRGRDLFRAPVETAKSSAMPKRLDISVTAIAFLAALPAAVSASTIIHIPGSISAYDGGTSISEAR